MQELHHFSLLKAAVLRTFCEANPYWHRPLSAFGVREIARFQQLMEERTGGRISEKSFYTHLKPDENQRLPRVDVLDLLSRFAGLESWAAFQSSVVVPQRTPAALPEKPPFALRQPLLLVVCGVAFLALLVVLATQWKTGVKTCEFCFVDALVKQRLSAVSIEVEWLREGESPLREQVRKGCHRFQTEAPQVTFVVRAAQYLPDTIRRTLTGEMLHEDIPLRRDDYAWLIQVFSTGQVADWQQRRAQLGEMLTPDATIFQVDASTGSPVEMYNATEFINKMTLPLVGLKNLRVLETEYDEAGRVKVLRFVQEEGD